MSWVIGAGLAVGGPLSPAVPDATPRVGTAGGSTCTLGPTTVLRPDHRPRETDPGEWAYDTLWVAQAAAGTLLVSEPTDYRNRHLFVQVLDASGIPVAPEVAVEIGEGSAHPVAAYPVPSGWALVTTRVDLDHDPRSWAEVWWLDARGERQALRTVPYAGALHASPPGTDAAWLFSKGDAAAAPTLYRLSLDGEQRVTPVDVEVPRDFFASVHWLVGKRRVAAHLGGRTLWVDGRVLALDGFEQRRVVWLGTDGRALFVRIAAEAPPFAVARVGDDGVLQPVDDAPSADQLELGWVGGELLRTFAYTSQPPLPPLRLPHVSGTVATGWTGETIVVAWQPPGDGAGGLHLQALDCAP